MMPDSFCFEGHQISKFNVKSFIQYHFFCYHESLIVCMYIQGSYNIVFLYQNVTLYGYLNLTFLTSINNYFENNDSSNS